MEGLYLDEQFFVPNLDSPIKILKINYKRRDFIWLGWVALSQVELTMAELVAEFEFWNTEFLLGDIITSFKYNWKHLSL